jgi:hypothetical protein
VAAGDAPTDGNPTHGKAGGGGFIQLPGGAFTADPQSLGNYDLAARKWLPVPHAWVSPDGTKYAWPEFRTASGPVTGIIHVTDVASGTDHPINVPAPSGVISWETAGIYITRVVPNSDAPPQGLSLLDPASEALHQITPDGAWRVIGGQSAYGADLDASIAAPPGSGPGAANRLRAVRLDSGAITTAQSFPGVQVQVIGAQGADVLLVLTNTTRSQVMLGSARIYDQPATAPAPMGPAAWDGTTVWLSGMNAVWRSVDGGQLEKIATPLSFSQVAGACR